MKGEFLLEKVSVVIAAYNIEGYIERCLDSVINQTYQNLEIIVVNDGSTDETLLKISAYEKKDSRLIVINQENKGLTEARKSGFSAVHGSYVLFIDGDDWLELEAVQSLYEQAVVGNYDVVQCKYQIRYDHGVIEPDWDELVGKMQTQQLVHQLCLEEINHNVWTKLIKVDYIKTHGITFLDGISFGEDLAFTFLLFVNQPKMFVINQVLYNYYQRSDSLTNQVSEQVLEIANVLAFIKDELIRRSEYEDLKEEIDYLFFRHGFLKYRDFIFQNKEYGIAMYEIWKSYDIDIFKNTYFHQQTLFKQKVSTWVYQLGYRIAKTNYDLLNCGKKFLKRGY